MIIDFLEALLKAGVIVTLITFAMVHWSLRKGYIDPALINDKSKPGKKRKASKQEKKQAKENGNFLYKKWLKFGGGYYGIVALMTYALVEMKEVQTFFANFESISHFISTISFQMLVNLFIESIMNFVTAISWPAYWIGAIDSRHIWVWFIASYFGYYLGNLYAHHLIKKPV